MKCCTLLIQGGSDIYYMQEHWLVQWHSNYQNHHCNSIPIYEYNVVTVSPGHHHFKIDKIALQHCCEYHTLLIRI